MENVLRRKRRITVLSALLLTIALAVASFFGAYTWQHAQVDSLQDKVRNLNEQVVSQNNQLSALKSRPTQTCPASPEKPTASTNCSDNSYTSSKGVTIVIYSPLKNAIVTSPLAIIGEVPGDWSSEAQFPILLKDSSGTVVTRATGHVLGNWQTTQLVPFSVQLIYSGNHSGGGRIILEKDNPSGLSANADSLQIPVSF